MSLVRRDDKEIKDEIMLDVIPGLHVINNELDAFYNSDDIINLDKAYRIISELRLKLGSIVKEVRSD